LELGLASIACIAATNKGEMKLPQKLFFAVRPERTTDNSPAIHRWGDGQENLVREADG
jgi:hypothetical protein